MKTPDEAIVTVNVGFAMFCAGAILAQHLTKHGIGPLSLIMGVPAWVTTRVLIWRLKKSR